jgi:hypothetical protein
MSLPSDHFNETHALILKVPPSEIAKWLLQDGYYPEPYVLPPCFSVASMPLQPKPIFPLKIRKASIEFKPSETELAGLSFPKSMLAERSFSIIDPRHYHDLVWYIVKDWKLVLDILFHRDLGVYSYSIPIPVSRRTPGKLGKLRAGRMIYEFIEMAENDLVAEAHRFSCIVKTDISSFYSAIYTHSIAWALHGKTAARTKRSSYDCLGKIIDKLLQAANDGRTNGIAIGPAISDLISEILLASIDRACSIALKSKRLDFLGVRYKDDYRFLCRSEGDARRIMAILQRSLKDYNLSLSEEKSEILKLPEGLYRPWKAEYQPVTLRRRKTIDFPTFENALLTTLQIDQRNPGTGVIDRFLSELTSKRFNLKLELNPKQRIKAYSLLLLLRERRSRSFASVLAIVEAMMAKYSKDVDLRRYVKASLSKIRKVRYGQQEELEHEILWIHYFLATVLRVKSIKPASYSNQLLRSVSTMSRQFFQASTWAILFVPVSNPPRNHLLRHLELFNVASSGKVP